MTAALLSVNALGQSEDHLLLAGQSDDGEALSDEAVSRLLTICARTGDVETLPDDVASALEAQLARQQENIRRGISERNARFFELEANKLDGWADDLKVGLERELKELDRQIKAARRDATAAPTLEGKLVGQKAVKALEAERSAKRRTLFDTQDRIDAQRAELIAQIEAKLEQKIEALSLFTIRWRLQ
ncbi:hypothetical protein [Hankyongella ginsenosidimutans]|uniref:hypothetical protein n=1 Tax=Hankyongella ginsenosidimutans TaxID=1763828 RepID=UPI001FE41D8E|nr:hypothetical protein [Hankyongella ginsenosidimutans]